jgi:hypothetical protein
MVFLYLNANRLIISFDVTATTYDPSVLASAGILFPEMIHLAEGERERFAGSQGTAGKRGKSGKKKRESGRESGDSACFT